LLLPSRYLVVCVCVYEITEKAVNESSWTFGYRRPLHCISRLLFSITWSNPNPDKSSCRRYPMC